MPYKDKQKERECKIKYVNEHRDEVNQYQRTWNNENRQKRNSYQYKWNAANKDKVKKVQQRNAATVKFKVLMHYGNGECKCVACGESRLPCLTIDHINGNGNTERRELGLVGKAFYRWLIKSNYPDGYQTLCMNCQFVKKYDKDEHYHGGGIISKKKLVGQRIFKQKISLRDVGA